MAHPEPITTQPEMETPKEHYSQFRAEHTGANSRRTTNRSDGAEQAPRIGTGHQSITDCRIKIQHAVGAEWPYSNDLNQGVRKEFFQPLSISFNR